LKPRQLELQNKKKKKKDLEFEVTKGA